MKYPVAVTVNGRSHRKEVEARTLLVDFLRDALELTGTHVACETSQCGACLVVFNGRTLKACTCLAVQADGGHVTTIEGACADGALHPAQEALLKGCALHCGFCAAGIVLAAREILSSSPVANEEEVRGELEGILCRCTGYQRVVDSILSASDVAVREALDGGARDL